MTEEEVFDDLLHKYGEDFNWHMLPFTNKTFVAELKNEIGKKHFRYEKKVYFLDVAVIWRMIILN